MSNPTTTEAPSNKVATASQNEVLLKKNITDSVLARIQPMLESKELVLPHDYVPANALISAWFVLQELKTKDGDPVLKVCTTVSIANSLFEMVVSGLSVAKKQVAFIAYGNVLKCQHEYHGTIALAKRYAGVKTVNAGVIYGKDEFKYSLNVETGVKKITEHVQLLENINDNDIKGAYAVLTFDDGSEPYVEIMTKAQIDKAWNQGAMKGQSPSHKNFPGEMCKKTVIGRACKLFITTSDDSALMNDDGDSDPLIASRNQKIKEGSRKELKMEEETPFEDLSKQPEAQAPAQTVTNEGPGY